MNSKNCLRALACAGAVLGSFSASADIPASAYVQDGLVGHWDGIENAGAGRHDNAATTWVDLAGGIGDATRKSDKVVWQENCWTNGVDGMPFEVDSDFARVLATKCFTLEVRVRPTRTSDRETIIGNYSAGQNFNLEHNGKTPVGCFRFYCNAKPDWGTPATVSADEAVTAAFVAPADGYPIAYKNGAQAGTHNANITASMTGDHGTIFGGEYNRTAMAFHGSFYSVRLYNRALTSDEVSYNAVVDKLRFGGQDDRYRWNDATGKLEIFVTAECRGVAGSTVSLNGGASAKSASCWAEYGSTLSITLTPAAGTSLNRWEGGTPTAGGAAGTYTVKVASALSLVAVCGNETKTWAGASGARWDDESSWDPEGVPAAGDVVTIPKGTKVVIAESTAKVGALDVLGVVSNVTWDAALNASSVLVGNGGEITCGGAFDDEANATRVNVVCDDLTVERGGKIHADKRGWKGGNTTHKSGYGPGAIPGDPYFAGGGHGGIGSYRVYNNDVPRQALATNEYGSASAPVTAGSGGWGGNGRGGHGGGVVTIMASGCVTVCGSVTADAEGSVSGSASAGGAGGSVFITCTTFQGANGRISANGGAAFTSYSQTYHSGGGGRVAILFDKAEQAKLPCPRGMYFGADTGGFVAPDESLFSECLPGSLYFSSDTLIDRTGATLFGKLDFADVTDKWTVDSVRLTNGWVMMARDDVEVNVTGDFEVTGDTLVTRRYNATTKKSTDATRGTRWDVGGATLYFATNSLGVYRMSSVAPRLTVGGDLKLSHYGLLYVYSSQEAYDPDATAPATDNLGAQVTVTGAIDLSDIGKMYVWSHPLTGVSPCFAAGSLSVDATSWIDANNAGFFGGNTSNFKTTCTRGLAPTNPDGKRGAGHGGAGGWGETASGTPGADPYDSLDWPVLCGGGGNSNYVSNWPGRGGGVLRFFVTGEVKVDGQLRANATTTGSFSGANAGGTVLVVCDRIVGSGDVQAKGCNAYQYTLGSSGHNGGAGGGGRIALHYNPVAQSNATCAVTFSAAGGVGVGDGVYTGNGEAGTVWFPDETVASNGKSHSGTLYVPELLNFIRRDSLVIDNATTDFAPGGYVEIAHDLTIRGTSAGSAGFVIPQGHFHVGGNLIIEKGHITVSGDAAHPRTDIFRVDGKAFLDGALITVECSDEDRDQVVSFGGEVVMTNATTITLKSPCDEVEGEPGLVFTAPKLEMHKDCWVYPWSHNTNGASCLFQIAEISCTSNSGFNASAKGYGRLTKFGDQYGPQTTRLRGYGVDGGNAYSSIAPGHGGVGGLCVTNFTATYPKGAGLTYDSRRKPVLAGCGGTGNYTNGGTPPRGGGVVRVESEVFRLNGGSLLADGGGNVGFRTGASGGSIYVRARRFFGGGGVLSAKGGDGPAYGDDASHKKNYDMAAGGGGRIAVWAGNFGYPEATNCTLRVDAGAVASELEPVDPEAYAARQGTAGTAAIFPIGGLKVLVR